MFINASSSSIKPSQSLLSSEACPGLFFSVRWSSPPKSALVPASSHGNSASNEELWWRCTIFLASTLRSLCSSCSLSLSAHNKSWSYFYNLWRWWRGHSLNAFGQLHSLTAHSCRCPKQTIWQQFSLEFNFQSRQLDRASFHMLLKPQHEYNWAL